MRSTWRGGGEFSEFLFLVMAPGETGDPALVFKRDELPEGVKLASMRTKSGHNTEVAIPAAYLNQKQAGEWTGFRLNISVNDRERKESDRSQIWWRPYWGETMTYSGSGSFRRR